MSDFKFIRGFESARENARGETARLEAWAEKYGWDVRMPWGLTRREIVEAARALGPDPDPAALFEATGISRWPKCTCCGQDRDVVAVIGEEPDYESSTVWMCVDCLRGCLAEMLAGTPEGRERPQ